MHCFFFGHKLACVYTTDTKKMIGKLYIVWSCLKCAKTFLNITTVADDTKPTPVLGLVNGKKRGE